jgi:hypothetical protein
MRIDPRYRSASRIVHFCFVFAGLTLFAGLFVQPGARAVNTGRGAGPADETEAAPQAVGLMISEFRLKGPNGLADEFIEIYNSSGFDHAVVAASGTGYGVAASDGIVRCTIPNGTFIPNRGHYLCTNSAGYSLGNYPAGSGTLATGDDTYTTAIPDNVGIALFNNNSGGGSFTLANRFDAVGSVAEGNALYREGTGYPTLSAGNVDYSFIRKQSLVTGLPLDSDNNASDFLFADTNGTSLGAGIRLGAPGPQNMSSAIGGGSFVALPLDGTKAISVSPNRVRDFTPGDPNTSSFGTLSIRRRFVNQTGGPLTRMRFRILDISSYPPSAGAADLRARSATLVVVAGIGDSATCAATGAPATPPCTVSVQGTTLETPPAQVNGGAFNSSMSAGTVTLGTPLANGASINLQLLFGVEAEGNYRLVIQMEGLPSAGTLFQIRGNTQIPNANSDAINTVSDYDGDGKTDLSVFRSTSASWFLLQSQAGFLGTQFGVSTDRIVPADYDGDGKTDIAVYRPSIGSWFLVNSATNTLFATQFGIAEDLPTPADYDGDGRADLCVFRPSVGSWFRLNSGNGAFLATQFGTGGDRPTLGDFDGDGKADLAVYRPTGGSWFRLNSSNGAFLATAFGIATDLTVPGDFDGDGKTDISVFRPSGGNWFRLNSSNGAFVGTQFGTAGDFAATGDYDLDGKEDISVFRGSDGTWYRLNSSNGTFFAQQFGQNGDRPTPTALQY